MGWRETLEKSKYWSYVKGYDKLLAVLTAENDLAESLGFEYSPDDRRGYGYGRFNKKVENGEIGVSVCGLRYAQQLTGWSRTFPNPEVTEDFPYERRTNYYPTLAQALRDEGAVAACGKYGMICFENFIPSKIR